MHSILAYNVNAGVNDNQVDMNAIVDPSFSRRGGSTGTSHWLFQVKLRLLAAYYGAAHAQQAVWNIPDWNIMGRQAIYPPNASLTIPTNPQIADWRDNPPFFPTGQEVAVVESNTLGTGNEQTFVIFWAGTPNWSRNPFPGEKRIWIPFTASPTLVANTWTADSAVTFTYPLTGGSYVVNGCQGVCPNGLAFRMNFVRSPLYGGNGSAPMKLYPGDLCDNAFGNVPHKQPIDWLGPWGAFNNLELPQLDFLGTAAGAQTFNGYLDCTYVGPQQEVPQLQGMAA